jgi:hypothetical protein
MSIFDKKGVYDFTLKFGQSKISIPIEIFVGIAAGAIIVCLTKVARRL